MSKIPELFNISQLEELTGIERRTISKTLESNKVTYTQGPKNAKLYKPSEALPVLYKSGNKQDEEETTELAKEKLLHATAKRKQAELDLAERQREVVRIDEVSELVGKEYSIIRAQFRSLPSKLAKHLAVTTEPAQVFEMLSQSINEVLSELQADAQTQLEQAPLEETKEPESNQEGEEHVTPSA